jgi:exopolysaccharide production protein ExoZ
MYMAENQDHRVTFRRIENLQALRGIAVLWVVGRHIMVFGERSIGHIQVLRDLFLSGDAGVDLFFAISGFVMVMTTRGKLGQPLAAKQFLFRRFTRIYPLYWIFTLVTLAVFLLHPELINRTGRGVGIDLIRSFFLWPQHGMPLLGQGWSLTYELFFYCVFSLLLLLKEDHLLKAISIWMICTLVGNCLISRTQIAELNVIFDPLVLEFILGAMVAIIFGKGWIPKFGWVFAALGIIGILIGGIIYHGETSITEAKWTRFGIYGTASVLVLYGMVGAELRSKSYLPVILRKMGDVSYSIYLTHILVIAGIAHIWHRKATTSIWEQSVMIGVMVFGTVIFGGLVYQFLEKPIHEFSRRLAMIWFPDRRNLRVALGQPEPSTLNRTPY